MTSSVRMDAACAATDNICWQREKRLSISHRVRNSARQREKRLSISHRVRNYARQREEIDEVTELSEHTSSVSSSPVPRRSERVRKAPVLLDL